MHRRGALRRPRRRVGGEVRRAGGRPPVALVVRPSPATGVVGVVVGGRGVVRVGAVVRVVRRRPSPVVVLLGGGVERGLLRRRR